MATDERQGVLIEVEPPTLTPEVLALAKRYHPDRHPAGAVKMAAVNRVADQLAAGVRRFSKPDTAIAREIIAAGAGALGPTG